MILYLDTSSLVKLYVKEAHSAAVRDWADEAEVVATCRVAYPETISAFTRRYRSGDIARRDYEALLKTFAGEWAHFAAIDFDEITAGQLAESYGLRGFDAVHLSAAKLLQLSSDRISVAFSSFDENLNKAAIAEKLKVLLPKA